MEINLLDTANVYANGRSEEGIGKAVQGYRDEIIIATTVGLDFGQGPKRVDFHVKI